MSEGPIKITNAVITRTDLGTEGRGMLSAWIHLDYGGSGQGFGGYMLHYNAAHKPSFNVCGLFVQRVLEVAGVESWENLKGRNVRVKYDYGKVYAIGHIIKDDWFDIKAEFDKAREIANA